MLHILHACDNLLFFIVLAQIANSQLIIGGWGLSPNREISVAPASVILRLGLWPSISPPVGRARALGEFE